MLSPEQLTAIAAQRGDKVASTPGSPALANELKTAWAGNTEPADTRNAAQKLLGTFLDPIIETGVRAGQAVGALGEKALGVDQAKIDRGLETTYKVPFLGTTIGPQSKETPEKVIGRGVSTVALGLGNPTVAGAGIGLGHAMENNADVPTAAIETVFSALFGKILEHGFNAVSPYAEKAVIKYGAPLAEKLQQVVPESAKANFDKLLSSLPDISKIKLMPDGASQAIEKGKEVVDNIPKAVSGKIGDWVDDIQLYLSKQNINPQVEASAERLSEKAAEAKAKAGGATGTGISRDKSPLDYYNGYLDQEQKFKTDAHADMALNSVGEDIGKAFDKAVTTRRAVGEKMGEELKKVGNLKTDVTESFTSLENELHKNQNLVYDQENKKLVSTIRQNKMTSEDRSLIEKYISDLNELGSNPTVAELDAFMSRIPKELNVYKSKNNITEVTNGERIIKSNLEQLRNNLKPDKNPALEDYYAARQAYAKLSNFLDEGSDYLGAKTQSGDYKRDASVAKSSVNSVLGAGKKDWLIQLEKLTGDPVLDKTVLALQAMKDSGNAQGQSLLTLMAGDATKGEIPTSKSQLFKQLLEWGKSKVAGSPPEQTRAFLEDLMKQP